MLVTGQEKEENEQKRIKIQFLDIGSVIMSSITENQANFIANLHLPTHDRLREKNALVFDS